MMGNGSWRRRLVVVVAILGFLVGVAIASILVAANSSTCEHLDRSITLLPPGLRCFGPKDGVRDVPWRPVESNPLELFVVVLAGGGLGAVVLGSLCSRVTRQRRSADPHDA